MHKHTTQVHAISNKSAKLFKFLRSQPTTITAAANIWRQALASNHDAKLVSFNSCGTTHILLSVTIV